jgi:hypothetical protein
MSRVVILGGTPAALRAAAFLAGRGAAVRYLGVDATGPSPRSEAPFESGAFAVGRAPDDVPRLETVFGTLSPFVPRRALLFEGRTWDLPLSPATLARMLGARGAARLAAGVVQARARRRLGNVFDMGLEERSYVDWLERRLGPVLVQRVFGPYARKRYGADPADLTAWLAWATHAGAGPVRYVTPAGTAAAREHAARDRILDAGGEILEGVAIEGVEVEKGRITGVCTDVGREHVDRLLLVDEAPRASTPWLPDDVAGEAWRFDAGRLDTAHEVRVTFAAALNDLPFELHVVDAHLPFWRVTRPSLLPEGHCDERVAVDLTLSGVDPLWCGTDGALAEAVRGALSGLVDVELSGAVVARVRDGVPIHRLTSQPSLVRRLDVCDALGWVGVGARGAFRHLDPALELALLAGVLDTAPPDGRAVWQREVHRNLFERPVRLPRRVSPWAAVAD